MENQLQAFIKGADKMPSMPAQMGRLIEKMNDSASSAKDLEKLILPDVTLSAKVLKLANSVFYCRMGKAGTVSEALVRLGHKTVRSLVITVWTTTLKSFANRQEDLNLLTTMLEHGTASAIITKALIQRVHPRLAEECFISGLLHDIGRVALACQMGGDYEKNIILEAEKRNQEMTKMETDVLGFDHTVLGASLLEKWNVPNPLVTAAREHHTKEEVNPADDWITAAVILSDYLATSIGWNISPRLPRKNRTQLLEHFGITDPDPFLEECEANIQTMSAILAD